jgi:hypothetical protein
MTNDTTAIRCLLLPEPDPAQRGSGVSTDLDHEMILKRIIATPRGSRPAGVHHRRRGRATLAAAGALCILVLALTFTRWPATDGGARAALPIRAAVLQSAAAAHDVTPRSVLERAAAATARSRDLDPRAIRYRRVMAGYLRIAGGSRPASVLVPETVETWWSPDGAAEIRHEGAAPIWPSELDRRAWTASGAPAPDATRTDHVKNADVDARRYPADPGTLARQLRREVPDSDRTARTLARLRDIRDAGASPALRAATFAVAARLPGIAGFGHVTDQLGRSGVAVGIDSAYSGKLTRYEMIFSSAGELLEYQEVLLEPATFTRARPPVQIAFEIEVHSGAAPAVGARP